MAQKPNYQLYSVNLSSAGSMDILGGLFDYFRMVDATDVNGVQQLGTLVNVKLGHAAGDAIPMRLNSLIRAETDSYHLSWAAQPGVWAYFLASENSSGGGIQVEAPAPKQLVTSAVGTGLTASRITVGTAATILAPASTTRQSVTIRNRDTAPIYLGDANVTLAAGFQVDPGDAFTISGTTGALWAISAAGSGTGAVHLLTEQ